jgi:V-type H+-transporting ATPase subunit H
MCLSLDNPCKTRAEPQPQSQRASVFATQGSQYAKLYIDLLRKLQRVDTVQAVLVAVNEMLSDPTTIPLFHQLASSEHPDDPYGPLIKCLTMEEEYAVLGSLRILALLISYVSFFNTKGK